MSFFKRNKTVEKPVGRIDKVVNRVSALINALTFLVYVCAPLIVILLFIFFTIKLLIKSYHRSKDRKLLKMLLKDDSN